MNAHQPSPHAPLRACRWLATATLAAALLSGCASNGPAKLDEAKIKQFASQGYVADERHAITTMAATWNRGASSFDVSIAMPAQSGPFPLLLYLPGLGETRAAGDGWRSAWAQAGYAVVSIQPLSEDAQVWTSARARAGDFVALARERYAGAAMRARIAALGGAMAELRRRHELREAPLERVDLSRVALIGYDLGAYTAMVIAGEKIRDAAPPPPLPLPVRAVIALSPYADFSGVPLGERYGGISAPVLSVTSDIDTDALALVPSPALRKAAFQYMPARDKYLLTLADIPHQTLAGGALDTGAEADSRAALRGAQRKGGKGAGGLDAGDSPGPSRLSPTDQAIGATALFGVTHAFLDAYVKSDSIAREWLVKNAGRWLGSRGELKQK